jgi:hypothetical protein
MNCLSQSMYRNLCSYRISMQRISYKIILCRRCIDLQTNSTKIFFKAMTPWRKAWKILPRHYFVIILSTLTHGVNFEVKSANHNGLLCLHKRFPSGWAPAAHICNPSYSGGRDQDDQGSKPARANGSWDPILKKPITKKGWGRGSRCRSWVQAQYHKKKKKKKKISF